ncbi:shikimate dehydrogenase [Thalassotalea hakodatensis]|uniref:shikimate dehydrogenase n=1 Tax=Thalassotalea hakodatensis TaxID=3030492 RepID=UPI0025748359|nr:shikimate dehydrogenase [Thalassotalea hakodatensis]
MDKYAVFGNPISQSKSPFIHQQFAEQSGQALQYNAIKPEHDDFCAAVKYFIASGAKGCNVTAPYKEQAYKLATTLSKGAELAGAVNTLTFNENGTIIGDNTDGPGLVEDLKANNANLQGRILLIGAGGASRGVIKPLLDCMPEKLVIVNRTEAKAKALAERFKSYGNIEALSQESLVLEAGFDIVINSTSASLFNELPSVPTQIFTNNTLAYDMAYRNEPTIFCQWALDNNSAKAVDGLGMLVGQAAVAFEIWRQVMPETKSVLANLRAELI